MHKQITPDLFVPSRVYAKRLLAKIALVVIISAMLFQYGVPFK